MEYCTPKGVDLKTAMERGWVLPGNFLGKLENTRRLTKEEFSQWQRHLSLKQGKSKISKAK